MNSSVVLLLREPAGVEIMVIGMCIFREGGEIRFLEIEFYAAGRTKLDAGLIRDSATGTIHRSLLSGKRERKMFSSTLFQICWRGEISTHEELEVINFLI